MKAEGGRAQGKLRSESGQEWDSTACEVKVNSRLSGTRARSERLIGACRKLCPTSSRAETK